MFASDIHTQGRVFARLYKAGFFCFRFKIRGSVPPCDDLMVSLPLWCMSTGKAEPFFYFRLLHNLSKMTYLETLCADRACSLPLITEKSIIEDISSYDHPDNLREDLRELMDAFFLYHDSIEPEHKDRIYNTYKVLSVALNQIKVLQSEKEVYHVNA